MKSKDPLVRKILDRHKKLKAKKQPWLTSWQMIGEFVRTMKQNFQGKPAQGVFLTGELFDNTAPRASYMMASSLQAALYPNARKAFRIDPPTGVGEDFGTKEVKDWYERITVNVQEACDNEASGLVTSISECFQDLVTFGTCGIAVLENTDDEDWYTVPVKFQVVDVSQMSIDVGHDGRIDTIYIEREKTVRQLADEYGIENVSERVRKLHERGELDEKVVCIHAVEPRKDRDLNGASIQDAPYASVHLEQDSEFILGTPSGYSEIPHKVSRFWVAPNEVYGRSPAFESMADIIEVNHLREQNIAATDKQLDPPLAMLDDGSAGGGTLDTSAGALNIRALDSFMRDSNRPLVEQILTVGELRSTQERIGILVQDIWNAFFRDEFRGVADITKRMTLGEVNRQNDIRLQSLGGIFARQISELLQPLVVRVVRILLGQWRLGVIRGSVEEMNSLAQGIEPFYIPDVVAQRMITGQDFFKVTFISPAARIMRNEELSGIQKTFDYALSMSQAVPDVMDNFDVDKAMHIVQDLTGAPSEIMKSAEERAQIRQQRAEAQAQQAQLAAQQMQADIAKSQTQAAHSAAKAQKESQ